MTNSNKSSRPALASRRVTVGSIGLLALYFLSGETGLALPIERLEIVVWPFTLVVVGVIAGITLTDIFGKKPQDAEDETDA